MRAPELGDGCRPGGSCPECNPEPLYCVDCGEEIDSGDLCWDCAMKPVCPQCKGGVDEPGFCSEACEAESKREVEDDLAYEIQRDARG